MTTVELPDRLNAASVFVDVHLEQGRADKTAILSGDEAITYRQLHETVNRMGNALVELGVRIEERVAILMPDSPEWVFAFFGAMKIGAVAVPMNTLLKSEDYEYLLRDSRARVLVVDPPMLERIVEIRGNLPHLEHVIVTGDQIEEHLCLQTVMQDASPSLEPADTSKDDMAFWLYSSGTTGFPRARSTCTTT